MKLYESNYQIVHRGINHDVIKEHIESKVEKILSIYDTKENFLNENFLNEDFEYGNSNWLAFYIINDEVQDEWIIESCIRLEEATLTKYPWSIVAGEIGYLKKV